MTAITAVTTPAGRSDGLTWMPKGDTMSLLRRVRCSAFQASLVQVYNPIFPVVRRAPVIMASPSKQRSPMTAGALRVLGVKR